MISKLRKSIKNKYQREVYSKKEIDKIYFYKKKIITKYFQKKIIFPYPKKKQLKSQLTTNHFFEGLLQKKITYKNLRIAYIFYKKFSTHLSLKEIYNLNLKKKTNKTTSIKTYVFFGYIIKKLDKLNFIQKLNIILKLNDIVLINLRKIKDIQILNIYSHNLIYEMKIIRKLLK